MTIELGALKKLIRQQISDVLSKSQALANIELTIGPVS